MLELTASCLTSGARLCIRCRSRPLQVSSKISRSFLADVKSPENATLASDETRRDGASVRNSSVADDHFLEFLYPPRALAWLAAVDATSPRRRLHDRHTARRPYARRAQHTTARDLATATKDGTMSERPEELESKRSEASPRFAPMVKAEGGDVHARKTLNRPATENELLEAIAAARQLTMTDDELSELPDLISEAWAIFERLGPDVREDVHLKSQMLACLAMHRSHETAERILALFDTLPKEKRDLAAYQAALVAAFDSTDGSTVPLEILAEALGRIPNGAQATKVLFREAINAGNWALAVAVDALNRRFNEGPGNAVQQQIPWENLRVVPGLMSKASTLLELTQDNLLDIGVSTQDIHVFRDRVFREAIHQELQGTDDEVSWPIALTLSQQEYFCQILTAINNHDPAAAPEFMEATLVRLLSPKVRADVVTLHRIVGHLLSVLVSGRNRTLPEEVWLSLVIRMRAVLGFQQDAAKVAGPTDFTSVCATWEKQHGRISPRAFSTILKFYAKKGQVTEFENWLEKYRSVYPDYQIYQHVLWMTVWVHALRADVHRAQVAFGEVTKEAAEHMSRPSVRAWGSLLNAYVRVDDLPKATQTLRYMFRHAIEANEFLIHPVLELLAKRGRSSTIRKLIKKYRLQRPDEPVPTIMYAPMVTAYVNAGKRDDALELLRWIPRRAESGRMEGNLISVFNRLAASYAGRRNVVGVQRTMAMMSDRGIGLNSDTWSSLLLALKLRGRMDRARRVLQEEMPHSGIRLNADHYGIVMRGYLEMKQYHKVMEVYNDMTEKNIPTNQEVRAILLQTKASLSLPHRTARGNALEPADTGASSQEPELKHALNLLKAELSNDPARFVANTRTSLPLAGDNLSDTVSDGPFASLVRVYSKAGLHDVVSGLGAQYKSGRRKGILADKQTSIDLLTNLLRNFTNRREHEWVEDCWFGILRRVDSIAPQRTPDLVTPEERYEIENLFERTLYIRPQEPWIPARKPSAGNRRILSVPLRSYLAALHDQGRVDDMENLVAHMLSLGYQLDNLTWNMFIKFLCRSPRPRTLLAFRLSEYYLVGGFPGWLREVRTEGRLRALEGPLDIDRRAMHPLQLYPRYSTILALARAYFDVAGDVGDGNSDNPDDNDGDESVPRPTEILQSIKRTAPECIRMIASMPADEKDDLQTTWLPHIFENAPVRAREDETEVAMHTPTFYGPGDLFYKQTNPQLRIMAEMAESLRRPEHRRKFDGLIPAEVVDRSKVVRPLQYGGIPWSQRMKRKAAAQRRRDDSLTPRDDSLTPGDDSVTPRDDSLTARDDVSPNLEDPSSTLSKTKAKQEAALRLPLEKRYGWIRAGSLDM